jgi:hypothetical protein
MADTYGTDAAEQQRIARNRQLANSLVQKASQPMATGQTAPGGVFVGTHPLQHLAQMLTLKAGLDRGEKSDQQALALGQRQEQRRGADLSLLAGALNGRQASAGGLQEDASGNVTPTDPVKALSPVQSLQQALPMIQDPQLQQFGLQAAQGAVTREDQQEHQRRQSQEAVAARAHERTLAEQAAAERLRQQQVFQDQQNRLRAQDQQGLHQMIAATRQDQRPPVAVVGPDGRPVYVPADQAAGKQPFDKKSGSGLPPAALKMQNELLEEASIAGNIQSDLAALHGQLSTGELNVGPVSNLWNKARNATGFSSAESQNFNTFETTLKRLQNDSLRLNKGVQTEGDAQRAWAELMGSINDPEVVKKRLEEIQGINQRAATLKKLQIDTIRSNFGLEGMDTAGFTNQPTTVTSASPKSDRRDSPRQGRTVVVNY